MFAPDDSHSHSAGSEGVPEGILIDLHLPKIKQKHCCILEIKAKKNKNKKEILEYRVYDF